MQCADAGAKTRAAPSVPTLPFLSQIAVWIKPLAHSANRLVVRLWLLDDDHLLATHHNQELIPGLHTQRLESLFGNHNLVLRRKRHLSHRFTFYQKVKARPRRSHPHPTERGRATFPHELLRCVN